jgi:hypothetical protein
VVLAPQVAVAAVGLVDSAATVAVVFLKTSNPAEQTADVAVLAVAVAMAELSPQ